MLIFVSAILHTHQYVVQGFGLHNIEYVSITR